MPEWVPNVAQRAVNRAIARIPFVAEALPKMYQTYGIDMPRKRFQNGSNTLGSVFFSPGFLSEYQMDPQVLQILEIYEQTGETKQIPGVARKKITISMGAAADSLGHTRELTGEDFSEWQRRLAGLTTQYFNKTLKSDLFKGATYEEQATMLAEDISYANTEVRDGWFRKYRRRIYDLPDWEPRNKDRDEVLVKRYVDRSMRLMDESWALLDQADYIENSAPTLSKAYIKEAEKKERLAIQNAAAARDRGWDSDDTLDNGTPRLRIGTRKASSERNRTKRALNRLFPEE